MALTLYFNDEPEERVQIWFDPTPKSCSIQKQNSGMIHTPLNGGGANEKVTIHSGQSRDWSVAELAAESPISRSAFAERFQATLGIPPLRYATEVRMHLAVRWLSSEKITVDVASQRLGYSSQAAFSRAFKRVTGKSPGAIRMHR